MSRNMSFSMTTEAVRNRTKTVTRRRKPEDHGSRCLPTRTVRITCGGLTVLQEIGSGRTDQRLLTWVDDEEVDALMRERTAVGQS